MIVVMRQIGEHAMTNSRHHLTAKVKFCLDEIGKELGISMTHIEDLSSEENLGLQQLQIFSDEIREMCPITGDHLYGIDPHQLQDGYEYKGILDITLEYYSYWTDCGTEYDMEYVVRVKEYTKQDKPSPYYGATPDDEYLQRRMELSDGRNFLRLSTTPRGLVRIDFGGFFGSGVYTTVSTLGRVLSRNLKDERHLKVPEGFERMLERKAVGCED